MARDDCAIIVFERVEETALCHVRRIEQDSRAFELRHQRASQRRERTGRACAARIPCLAPRRSDDAHARVKPFLGLFRRNDRVCTFHQNHQAHARFWRGKHAVHIAAGGDERHARIHREHGIVRDLFHCLIVRLLRCRVRLAPAGTIRARLRDVQRREHHAHIASNQLWESDNRGTLAVRGIYAFARAFRRNAFEKIAIERNLIPGNILVRVNDDGIGSWRLEIGGLRLVVRSWICHLSFAHSSFAHCHCPIITRIARRVNALSTFR